MNSIYCFQRVVIARVVSIWVLNGKRAFPDGVVVLIGILIFIFCAVLAKFCDLIGEKHGSKRT